MHDSTAHSPVTTHQHPPLRPDLPRVLILMTDHHLGNVVISLPVIERLASYFTRLVDVMIDERYAVLGRLLPSRPRILNFPQQIHKRRTLWTNLRPIAHTLRLTLRRYSCVIDVGGGTRSATMALLSLSLRRHGLRNVRKSWMYSRRVDASDAVHYFDRYSRLLRFIGDHAPPPLLKLTAPDAPRRALQRELSRHIPLTSHHSPITNHQSPITNHRPLILFHVGAGDLHRIYPIERFAAAADLLILRHNAQICAIGTHSERPLIDQFLAAIKPPHDAFALHLPLDQLLALFEQATLIISNEGGPTHLAAATDLPIVTLFGPSREENWRPIRDHNTTILRGDTCDPACIRSHCVADLKCLLNITPQTIVQAAEAYLTPHPTP